MNFTDKELMHLKEGQLTRIQYVERKIDEIVQSKPNEEQLTPFLKVHLGKLREELKEIEVLSKRLQQELYNRSMGNLPNIPIRKATEETIDDLIEEWHKSDSKDEIYVYLGITYEAYKQYVETGKLDSYLKNNYYCTTPGCTYKTGIQTEQVLEADNKLLLDGGFDQKKQTHCPTCANNSLVFIPK